MFFVDNIVCGADEMQRKKTECRMDWNMSVLCFLFGYADKDLNADLYRGIFEQIKRYQDFADKFKQKLLSDLSIGLYLKSACSYWIRKYDILLKTLKSVFYFKRVILGNIVRRAQAVVAVFPLLLQSEAVWFRSVNPIRSGRGVLPFQTEFAVFAKIK